MKYRKKPATIEAISFDELVAHGRRSGAAILDGMPQLFEFKGCTVTFVSKDRYLIDECIGLERGSMLVQRDDGSMFSMPHEKFTQAYEAAPEPSSAVNVERREDMSTTGKLKLHIQEDGDICLAVWDERGIMAGVEFCTTMAGGGKSPNTRKALYALFEAMERDNRENPI